MKRFVSALLLLCCLWSMSCVYATETECEPQIIAGNDANAYLVYTNDSCYLMGYAEYEVLLAVSTQIDIDFIVQYCEHEEHVKAKAELATQLNAVVVSVTELPTEMVQEETIVFGGFAFSADKKVDTLKTIDCLGNYLKYAASTNESSVNVRKEPTTKAERVGKLQRGDTLTVIGEIVNSKGEMWYQVELENGKQGYIRSDLVEVAEAVPEANESATQVNKTENRYIGNKKSKVFHRPGCEHLPSSKNIVYFSSRSYAVSKGYKPCSHCNP